MKFFTLSFLLIFLAGHHGSAQQSKAREIVNQALQKHTSGRVLNRYDMKVRFDKPGETPSIYRQDPFAGALDSIMATLSDSAQTKFQKRIDEGKTKMFQKFIERNTIEQELYRVDIELKKLARVVRGYNQVVDSLSMVQRQDIYNSDYFFLKSVKLNPVALVQLMQQDSAQLHYIETSGIENADHYMVQVKVRKTWLSVYFNRQTYLVDKMIEPRIDNDAYFGQDHYNEIVLYTNYKLHHGFLLPGTIEEITSILPLSKIENVSWLSINKPFAAVLRK
jgi:hypothetical protein